MTTDLYDHFCRLDSTTLQHSLRVMLIAREFTEYENDRDLRMLPKAALVHDIGKLYVADEILDKAGSLSDTEREFINLHAYAGYRMLKENGVDDKIASVVLFHHGMKPVTLSAVKPDTSDDVRELAKMLHTIDVFEALTSDRPYHRGVESIVAVRNMQGDHTLHDSVMRFLHARAVSGAIPSAVHTAYFSGHSPVEQMQEGEIHSIITGMETKRNDNILAMASGIN